MRQPGRADADDAALRGVLEAAATLLDRLATARDTTDRAAHTGAFDGAVQAVRERLVRDYGLGAGEADRRMARALARAAILLRTPL